MPVLSRPLIAYLWLNQDKVNEEHDKVMLDIFVGESLASRTLRQSHAFTKRTVVGLAIGSVESVDWKSTFNAYRHLSHCLSCVYRKCGFVSRGFPKFGNAWHAARGCDWWELDNYQINTS